MQTIRSVVGNKKSGKIVMKVVSDKEDRIMGWAMWERPTAAAPSPSPEAVPVQELSEGYRQDLRAAWAAGIRAARDTATGGKPHWCASRLLLARCIRQYTVEDKTSAGRIWRWAVVSFGLLLAFLIIILGGISPGTTPTVLSNVLSPSHMLASRCLPR